MKLGLEHVKNQHGQLLEVVSEHMPKFIKLMTDALGTSLINSQRKRKDHIKSLFAPARKRTRIVFK